MEAGGISAETQGMSTADIEKMRSEMEDEIRSQLLANQAELAGAEGTGPSWDEKVERLINKWSNLTIIIFNINMCYIYLLMFIYIYNSIHLIIATIY